MLGWIAKVSFVNLRSGFIATSIRSERDQMSPKTILVTGAAKRVGAAIVRELHAANANIVLHYRHAQAAAEELADELNAQRPHSVFCQQADLLELEALPILVENAIKHFGHLDALINNASTFYATPLADIDLKSWHELVGSNLQAPLFLAQAAAPHLKARRGCVINITDIHAERPLAGFSLYSAAKAGLLGLTRALAVELAPEVRVNAVAPGAILWPEKNATGENAFSAQTRAQIIEHTLLKRAGCAEDIARTVRFLIFDAAYITGQVINVDGGRTAYL